MKLPRAVIFDMDGVLVDSSNIHNTAFEEVVRQYGCTPKRADNGMIQILGMKEQDNWEHIKKVHGIDEDIAILMKKRGPIYERLLRKDLRAIPGAVELIQTLKKRKIPLALASSGIRRHVEMTLEGLKLQDAFAATVAGDEVTHSKPHPEIFLKAAHKLGVEPAECLVIEDAPSGVEAGRKAGMRVIALLHKHTARKELSLADHIVSDLREIINFINSSQ